MHRIVLAVMAVSAPLIGCSEKTEQVRTLLPLIEWSDLAAVPLTAPEDGYVNLVPAGTVGEFPSSIVIARITVDADRDDPSVRRIRMSMSPANDFLSWNALFDNLRYVSEAFPLGPNNLGEDEPSATRIVQAAGELRAGMCLVYGRSDPSVQESLVRGVIYDARTATPLAAVSARATAPEPESVERPPELAEGDDRYCNPRVLADRRFEGLVRECLRDLHRSDRPAKVQAPEGWTPEEPLWPRIWPPSPSPYKPTPYDFRKSRRGRGD